MGRELMMPDELMRFKFGDAIFMGARKFPIKSNVMPIGKYPIKFKMSKIPEESKNFDIKCFDLDKFRRKTAQKKDDYKVELI